MKAPNRCGMEWVQGVSWVGSWLYGYDKQVRPFWFGLGFAVVAASVALCSPVCLFNSLVMRQAEGMYPYGPPKKQNLRPGDSVHLGLRFI